MSEINQYQAPQSQVDMSEPEVFSKPRIFGVSGRLGRIRYIAYSFGITFLWVMLVGILMAIAIPAFGAQNQVVMFTLVSLYYLGIFIYMFMVTIQRCHDFNVSGWLSLVVLIPLAGLIFWFIPGTKGPNNFGNPPPPNHAGLIITGLILPIVLIGVLAAIAIPAYQGYVEKAQQNQLQYEQQR